jgi:hypothetical protein
MEKVKTRAGQSLLDIAVQECGSLSGVFGVADANGASLTDDLAPGTQLDVPERIDGRTAGVFAGMLHKPATALSETDELLDSDIEIFDDTFDETFE